MEIQGKYLFVRMGIMESKQIHHFLRRGYVQRPSWLLGKGEDICTVQLWNLNRNRYIARCIHAWYSLICVPETKDRLMKRALERRVGENIEKSDYSFSLLGLPVLRKPNTGQKRASCYLFRVLTQAKEAKWEIVWFIQYFRSLHPKVNKCYFIIEV